MVDTQVTKRTKQCLSLIVLTQNSDCLLLLLMIINSENDNDDDDDDDGDGGDEG